jgi:hypothetical protein
MAAGVSWNARHLYCHRRLFLRLLMGSAVVSSGGRDGRIG